MVMMIGDGDGDGDDADDSDGDEGDSNDDGECWCDDGNGDNWWRMMEKVMMVKSSDYDV